MWVIFIIGMPGSGKSTVAEVLYRRLYFLLSLPFNSQVNRPVEVSEVVRRWVEEKSGASFPGADVYTTERRSPELYSRLWSCFRPCFNICVGARETHLLVPPLYHPYSSLHVLTVSLLLLTEERRRRYILRSIQEGKTRPQANALFEKVEHRAIELGLPDAINESDSQIVVSGRNPIDIAIRIWEAMWRKGDVK